MTQPNDPMAAIADLERQREDLVRRLTEEREVLRERIRQIDGALITLRAPRPPEPVRGRGRPRAGTVTTTDRAILYIEQNPGHSAREIMEATGLRFPEVFGRLVDQCRIRREGESGSYRYYPIVAAQPESDANG